MNEALVDALVAGIRGFSWFVFGYLLLHNVGYLVLLVLATGDVARSVRRPDDEAWDDVFANPLTPAVSVVTTAHNEEDGVVECARAALSLRYPQHEVIIVDDGSTDETFERLRAEYDLIESDRPVERAFPNVGQIRSVHVARGPEPLVVVRKETSGTRADGINAGLNASRYPLVCCIDADSVLEPDALLKAVKPFVDDPERMVATGGSIQAANGVTVHRGRVTSVRQPRTWVARVQVVEYLRAFVLGRVGWSRFGGLLIISGAFGLYRRDVLAEVGGFDVRSFGEDADVLVAIHRHLLEKGVDYRVGFLAGAANWTEVPGSWKVLARQRRRWHHGLAQVLWKQRGMIGNRRYGRIGLVALPFYVVFELLGPVIEAVGLLVVPVGVALGVIDPLAALLILGVSTLFSVVLSAMTLFLEEVGYRRYQRWLDLPVTLAAMVVEHVGYRQLHVWWRLRGLVTALRGRGAGWGEMTREGFRSEEPVS